MITPKCPKCGGSVFALSELHVKDAKYILYAVCCDSCSTIVSTEPYFDISTRIDVLAKKLGVSLAG
jgi:hypothetical protein